jgi:hypothetical protein
MNARRPTSDAWDMRRTLNIRLDAPTRENRGGLARFAVDLDGDGLPLPIVVRGRVYVYAGEETTREGVSLWTVFADTGPVAELAA